MELENSNKENVVSDSEENRKNALILSILETMDQPDPKYVSLAELINSLRKMPIEDLELYLKFFQATKDEVVPKKR